MSSSSGPIYIDHVINQIITSNNLAALNHTFKAGIAREAREQLLSSFLSTGQDPLAVLDLRTHTLGVLYIMSARLSSSFGSVPPPPWQIVDEFCRRFDPDQARLAPDRITKLAKGIHRLASHHGNTSLAIPSLYSLTVRYPYDPSYLTTVHPIFLLTCVSTSNFTTALPILEHPITNIELSLSPDMTYNDNLTYHYTGGIALAALKRWKEAEEYFEICVTSPGTYPAALQMEALKKLRLVQLISTGKVSNLPKYTHPLLFRLFKATPYANFVNAYPQNSQQLREIYEKERGTFSQEKNLGLIQQAINRAPRWVLKKLTATYVTLHLSEIGRQVKIESEDEVRALLLSMIESNDISAEISATGTVTFSDPPPQFTKQQVDRVLRDVQSQTGLLVQLELEVGKSKEFLSKVVKTTDAWAPAQDEELFANMGPQHMWDENVYT